MISPMILVNIAFTVIDTFTSYSNGVMGIRDLSGVKPALLVFIGCDMDIFRCYKRDFVCCDRAVFKESILYERLSGGGAV